MLKSLYIKNFILIEEAKLDFKKGFNVLCGETGAGKTIIIKALDCALGAKITREMILDKDKPALIEAVFEENNEETTISREISSSSKFRLNGLLSSQDEIKDLRYNLLDIHSQHQTYSYMQSKNHIKLLDSYITKKFPEYDELLNTYKTTFLDYKTLKKRIEDLKENFEENQKEIEFLTFQLKELDDLALREGEEEELNQEIDVLSNIQDLKEGSYSAYWALYGGEQSIIDALSKIKYEIDSLSNLDKTLEDTKTTLFDAYENLRECANSLENYSSNLELNPERLDELNERLSLIQKMKRKYGEDLDKARDEIAIKLDNLGGSDNNLCDMEKNLEVLFESVEFLAGKIEEYRQNCALELSGLVEEKLKSLELKEARFEILVNTIDYSDSGKNKVEFIISTNKKQDLMPLVNVASGGEISRIMLALKTIFAHVDKVKTVVFDEIDTGISGSASSAVGISIVELSKETQVICITHQPIIAAKADNFIWISKSHDDKTNIKTQTLNPEDKLKALAQLASGSVDEKSIEFAKTLI